MEPRAVSRRHEESAMAHVGGHGVTTMRNAARPAAAMCGRAALGRPGRGCRDVQVPGHRVLDHLRPEVPGVCGTHAAFVKTSAGGQAPGGEALPYPCVTCTFQKYRAAQYVQSHTCVPGQAAYPLVCGKFL